MCSCHQAWSHHNWLFVGLRQFSQDKQTAEEMKVNAQWVILVAKYIIYLLGPYHIDMLDLVGSINTCWLVRSCQSVKNLGSFLSDFSTVQCCDVRAIIHHDLHCFRLMDWCLFYMSIGEKGKLKLQWKADFDLVK